MCRSKHIPNYERENWRDIPFKRVFFLLHKSSWLNCHSFLLSSVDANHAQGAVRQSACVPHHAPAFLPSTLLYSSENLPTYPRKKVYIKGPSNEISIAILNILLPVLNPIQFTSKSLGEFEIIWTLNRRCWTGYVVRDTVLMNKVHVVSSVPSCHAESLFENPNISPTCAKQW